MVLLVRVGSSDVLSYWLAGLSDVCIVLGIALHFKAPLGSSVRSSSHRLTINRSHHSGVWSYAGRS